MTDEELDNNFNKAIEMSVKLLLMAKENGRKATDLIVTIEPYFDSISYPLVYPTRGIITLRFNV
jgi:hypothetical protein